MYCNFYLAFFNDLDNHLLTKKDRKYKKINQGYKNKIGMRR